MRRFTVGTSPRFYKSKPDYEEIIVFFGSSAFGGRLFGRMFERPQTVRETHARQGCAGGDSGVFDGVFGEERRGEGCV